MDLNASPEPEEDEVFPEPHSEEDNAHEEHIEFNQHVDHGEPAISTARREREERIQRMRRQHPDDRPSYGYQPSQRDDEYQVKRQRPNSKLPPGWLDCPAYGNEIIGALVPSKVPLGESFNQEIVPGKRYSSKQVVNKQRVLGRKIGLVIDLTNSSRYYNVNDWRKEGIKHVKIACKGRDSVPESEAVNKFVYEVSQFLARQRQPRKHILVHCTHGHNRTGYMIVHFLMRTLPISVTQAIKVFSEARPPGIYKPDYIDALYNFYHEKKPDMVVCPPTPEWKRSSDLDLNGEAVPANIYKCRELVDLRLARNLINGNIPSQIGSLSMLTNLNLGNNELQGSIPEEFGKLTSLQNLELISNNLTGTLPKQIGNMTSLITLDLSSNRLTGTLPKQIGNMTSLIILDLSYNRLTGELPEEVGNLRRLEVLGIPFNELYGSIPSSIFNISTLELLGLQQNNLSGTLPPDMGLSLINLQGLYLFLNKLTGEIPKSINNASNLFIIELNRNFFTGPVPDLSQLRFLEHLKIWENNLSGAESPTQELPFLKSLTNSPNLESVEMTDNPRMSGVIPASIGNFSNLQLFMAASCDIRGPIPPEFGNISGLLGLHLSENQLTGFLPTTFAELKKLQRLYLGNNRLQLDIPHVLCKMSSLGELNFSYNMITGSLHECLGELKSLRQISFESNMLSSVIPPKLWDLTDLVILHLSSNNLSGEISPQVGNLKAITQLDLSSNQFSGEIPSSIGQCQLLQELFLSNNSLTGKIPKSLEALVSLEYFDVSYNKLEGEIPNGGRFPNFTAQSFAHNSVLCGEARFQVPSCKGRSKSNSRLVKYIVPPFFAVIILVVIIVIFIRRRKQKEMPPPVNDLEAAIWRRISYLELERGTSSFSETNLLGRGSFGSVFKGILSDGLDVAVKVFSLDLEGATKSFDAESEILSSIRHRNLVRVIGCCVSPEFRALILAYMPNGNLENWLYSKSYFLDLVQRLQIAIDVALALEYLHHHHTFVVVHCDVKPSNVLLDEQMIAHVADFGVSKLFDQGQAMVHTKTLATIGYAAPEYGSEGKVSTNGDVYSYGILLLEMFTQKRPTDDMFSEEMNIKEWVNGALEENEISEVVAPGLLSQEDPYSDSNMDCVASVFHLAMKCVAFSPEERNNMVQVVAALQKIKLKVAVEEAHSRR